MSSGSLVGYVEGAMEFITPSAAADFGIATEADWKATRDRIIDLLGSGKNAAFVLCNEERARKGQPPLPDPKPDYTNDYAKTNRAVRRQLLINELKPYIDGIDDIDEYKDGISHKKFDIHVAGRFEDEMRKGDPEGYKAWCTHVMNLEEYCNEDTENPEITSVKEAVEAFWAVQRFAQPWCKIIMDKLAEEEAAEAAAANAGNTSHTSNA